MRSERFGCIDRTVPIIGQGSWMIEEANRDNALAALRQGIDVGMVHIDTAEMYGNGASEALVGEAIAGRRDEVYLVSKVLPSNASRRGVLDACERSLRNLRTDRLDCYLLHWRGPHPLAETFAAFETLKQSGKILAWGVSNFDVDDLEEAEALVGKNQIACNQVLYHLGERAIEHAVLPWCIEHGVAIVAYSPFGQQRFPTPTTPGGKVLARIANERGASARQVALAFLTADPAVFAIPKASSVDHATENAGAGDIRLSDADIQAIDAVFARGKPPRHLPVL